MKKLLITGSTGLLGSACLREFSKDHEIVTPERIDFIQSHKVRQMFYDFKPEIVIHCAAKVGGVKANKEQPVSFMLENLKMQNNIIEAAHDYKVEKLCFIGTSCMFPRDAELPVKESSLLTGKLEESVEAYALAKIAGWRLCKAYWEEFGDRFITVAPSNIYGIGDNYGPSAHVIPALILKFYLATFYHQPVEVWGDGSALREFIFADDAASAIRVALEKWNSPEVINLGTGVGVSIKDLAQLIGKTSGYDFTPPIEWNTSQPTGIPRKTFSIANLASLGWTAKTSLEDGLRAAWNDFKTTKTRGL